MSDLKLVPMSVGNLTSLTILFDKYHSKSNYKHIVGRYFEEFACQYFRQSTQYKSIIADVWRRIDAPSEVIEYLKLPTRDKGIDIILKSVTGEYYIVQVKYVSARGSKIDWIGSHLNNFEALLARCYTKVKAAILFTTSDRLTELIDNEKMIHILGTDLEREPGLVRSITESLLRAPCNSAESTSEGTATYVVVDSEQKEGKPKRVKESCTTSNKSEKSSFQKFLYAWDGICKFTHNGDMNDSCSYRSIDVVLEEYNRWCEEHDSRAGIVPREAALACAKDCADIIEFKEDTQLGEEVLRKKIDVRKTQHTDTKQEAPAIRAFFPTQFVRCAWPVDAKGNPMKYITGTQLFKLYNDWRDVHAPHDSTPRKLFIKPLLDLGEIIKLDRRAHGNTPLYARPIL